MKYVELASAVVMIVSGLYLAWYWYNDIRERYDDQLTGNVLDWQERIQQWIDDNRALLAVVFGAVVLASVVVALQQRRRQSIEA
jgi:hypothetical protein